MIRFNPEFQSKDPEDVEKIMHLIDEKELECNQLRRGLIMIQKTYRDSFADKQDHDMLRTIIEFSKSFQESLNELVFFLEKVLKKIPPEYQQYIGEIRGRIAAHKGELILIETQIEKYIRELGK